MRRIVVLESPYAGDIDRNVAYARACLLDSIKRGEAPIAGHLLYTQVLDDTIHSMRQLGIECHLAHIDNADAVVVYADNGISHGMQLAIDYAQKIGKTVEHRFIFA